MTIYHLAIIGILSRNRPRFFVQVGHETMYIRNHLVEISIFSLNHVIVRPTKIMNRAGKNWAHFLENNVF